MIKENDDLEKRIPKENKDLSIKDGYKPNFLPAETLKLSNDPLYPIGTLPFIKTYHCFEGYIFKNIIQTDLV